MIPSSRRSASTFNRLAIARVIASSTKSAARSADTLIQKRGRIGATNVDSSARLTNEGQHAPTSPAHAAPAQRRRRRHNRILHRNRPGSYAGIVSSNDSVSGAAGSSTYQYQMAGHGAAVAVNRQPGQ